MSSKLVYELIGWIGSILFGACGVPQAWDCYKRGNGDGLSVLFLLTWFAGELLTIIYVWTKRDVPLLVNYSFNILCLLAMFRYKLWPRR